MIQLPCKFAYQPRWTTIIVGIVFFGIASAVLAHEAAINDRGMIIEGIFHFAPPEATVILWALAGLGGLFVIASTLATVNRIVSIRFLELTMDSLVLPHGFLQSKTSRVPYSSISTLVERKVYGQTFLEVHTSARKYTITASLLPTLGDYYKLREFLVERTRIERGDQLK